MWQLKIFFVFMLGFFKNGVAEVLPEVNFRILGGEDVNITRYPHQVALLYRLQHYCGGSIISEKYVLTAAQCIHGIDKVEDYQIRAGSSYWAKDGVVYDIESLLPHPKFKYGDMDYDIGLIKISGTIDINGETTKIVKLIEASGKLAPGDMVMVTGWGGKPQRSSIILKAARLPVVDHKKCNKAWIKYDRKPISNNMVCAGYLEPLQTICNGDPGGPMVAGDMVQHGVISMAPDFCDNKKVPNVFTSVASLRSWIKENSGV